MISNRPDYKYSLIYLLPRLVLMTSSLLIFDNCLAAQSPWRLKHTLQGYYQTYSSSSSRTSSVNAGYFLSADYLDLGNISFAYNSTSVNFENNAKDSGQLFYLGAQKHYYLDNLPGKLSLRGALYFGEDSFKYKDTVGNSVPGPGPGPGPGPRPDNTQSRAIPLGEDFIAETTDIDVFYADLAYIKYDKSFYSDVGYAHSKYTGSVSTSANQLTPSIGVGWNQSYDWIQLRAYLIDLDEQFPTYKDDQFESLEIKYTHWYPNQLQSKLELVQVSALLGDRILAVDPDSVTIYSNADIQKASFAGSLLWKLSANTKLLTLIQFDQYQDANLQDYDSFLIYLNFQYQQ